MDILGDLLDPIAPQLDQSLGPAKKLGVDVRPAQQSSGEPGPTDAVTGRLRVKTRPREEAAFGAQNGRLS